jgi:hypothetical protein
MRAQRRTNDCFLSVRSLIIEICPNRYFCPGLGKRLGKTGRGFPRVMCSPQNAITGLYFSVDCADFASGRATCWSKYTAVNFPSAFISSADGLPPW